MAEVLVLADFWLPGHLAGGPIRSITRIVALESECFDLRVVTRDHDLGVVDKYPTARSGQWVDVHGAQVLYVGPKSPKDWTAVFREIRKLRPGIVYLNSVFSPLFALLPAVVFILAPGDRLVLIAPRGELDRGALSIKSLKKRSARLLLKPLLRSRKVVWHASSQAELGNIEAWLRNDDVPVVVQPDPGTPPDVRPSVAHEAEGLRVVWLSRIVPKKDLLRFLLTVGRCDFEVSAEIFGPIEDADYWTQCEAVIASLPQNVKVNYGGTVDPIEVPEVFRAADVFLFPTRGENFGHVIAEALAVGCPVVATRTTYWTDILAAGGGLASDDDQEFLRYLSDLAERTAEDRLALRQQVWDAYSGWHSETRESRTSLFNSAIEARPRRS